MNDIERSHLVQGTESEKSPDSILVDYLYEEQRPEEVAESYFTDGFSEKFVEYAKDYITRQFQPEYAKHISKFLDPEYVKKSIEELEPINDTYHRISTVQDLKDISNNYWAAFVGFMPRVNFFQAPFLRLLYTKPGLIQDISISTSRLQAFREFGEYDKPERKKAVELYEKVTGKSWKNWDTYNNDKEVVRIFWEADEKMWQLLPWDKMFQALQNLRKLTDIKDIPLMTAHKNFSAVEYAESRKGIEFMFFQ